VFLRTCASVGHERVNRGAAIGWRLKKALSNVGRMKHAGDEALDQLEALLEQLRTVEGLREKKRGCFYRRSKAFLHFHEDAAGLFVDVRCNDEFQRFPVGTTMQRADLLVRVKRALEREN
jgi:hypothetical protein